MDTPRRKHPPTAAQLRDRQKTRDLTRIADSLERLVIAADSIATAVSLQAIKAHPNKETLDELMLRHERIARKETV